MDVVTKLKTVGTILALTSVVYIFLVVAMPIVSSMANTANATMAASSNMSNYPGVSGGLTAMPLVLYFIPGTLAIAGIIIVLRQPSG